MKVRAKSEMARTSEHTHGNHTSYPPWKDAGMCRTSRLRWEAALWPICVCFCAGFQTLLLAYIRHTPVRPQLQLVAGDKKKNGVNECKLQIVFKLFCNAEAASVSAFALSSATASSPDPSSKKASKTLKAFAGGNRKGVKETNENSKATAIKRKRRYSFQVPDG